MIQQREHMQVRAVGNATQMQETPIYISVN